jgi:site-specific recombinase XerD
MIGSQLRASSTGAYFVASVGRERFWGTEMTEKVVWHVVKQYAGQVGILKLAPHDLRRSCARLCHSAGGELEQIQFLLGHVSAQTTEKYLGCKQRLREAVNDKIGIEPVFS